MSKRRKVELVDTSEWPKVSVSPIDWQLCILCQRDNQELLVAPKVAGYSSLVDNLTEFDNHGALPLSVRFEQMDDGSGVLETLIKQNARYHKVCRNRYDAQKISRLSASISDADSTDSELAHCSRNMRSSSEVVDIKTSCLFCDGVATATNKLVQASTMDIGPKIHEDAVKMQNTKLLSKLATN